MSGGRVCGAGAAALLRLRGGLIVERIDPPLRLTQEWLEATTFDGTPVHCAFHTDWNGTRFSKEELLWKAVEIGDADAIERLIKAGADINDMNLAGQIPLHSCAMAGHEDLRCLAMLVLHGANITHKDNGGWDALTYALDAAMDVGPPIAVTFLMEVLRSIDVDPKNSRGFEEQPELMALFEIPPEQKERLNGTMTMLLSNFEDGGYEAVPSLQEVNELIRKGLGVEKQKQEITFETRRNPRRKKFKNVSEKWRAYKEKKKKKKQLLAEGQINKSPSG
ncbi:hypothetical protein GUITHDRAFT_142895 [Guillardia theta CCMP2712]|uniref:Uncharacterized protein n=1 Tax=Guillardia theta (strain CCMP2712) TaxID=905079 RepID=L1IWA3_GUITC|nr:hypothetical protein GUITHDRAFT_142895 [Guillardia theta CCMP2712]EKX40164.1 hypothetical protein GUITHDRAFT_142895 [Guillardia theta CCMP2712]|eukprot:XP_005827144.1 hypothetical protein GUITHDRAFT_142895 [Guillardia theta CCMP2712]